VVYATYTKPDAFDTMAVTPSRCPRIHVDNLRTLSALYSKALAGGVGDWFGANSRQPIHFHGLGGTPKCGLFQMEQIDPLALCMVVVVPPAESEMLAARLARTKVLIESLEVECSHSVEVRDTIMKLKRELDVSHKGLRTIK
jgi:hypothetical protein